MGDRWLAMEFAPLLLTVAQRLRLDDRSRRTLNDALRSARLGTAPLPTTVRALTDGKVPRSLVRSIQRTDACPILTAHLEPLLNPVDFGRFLERLARDNFFFRAAGAQGAVPFSVLRQEQARDRELVERWVGAPPARAQVAPTAGERARPAAEKEYQAKLDDYNQRRRTAAAFVASEPNAFPLAVPSDISAKEARTLEALNQAGRAGLMPVIILRGGLAPANLYVSEAAPLIAEYLPPLRAVLEAAGRSLGVSNSLSAVAYGMLALVSVPINCLYDNYHGTCAIETLAPRLLACSDVMSQFAHEPLRRTLESLQRRTDEPENPNATVFLDGFASLVEGLAAGFRGSIFRLLHVAADQGARVRTPIQLTTKRQWEFIVPEPKDDGTLAPVTRTAPEAIAYVGTDRDRHSEIFWILPSLWSALATGVALANQSGVRVWINAANNRWGGNHPPHRVHRQGCSLDLDAGLVWRDDKVRNVVKRDYAGFPLPEAEMKGNRGNADCLHLTERLAGWIITQSFVIVGVTQYLYGDAGLVEEAYAHLRSHFQVLKPARMDGVVDAKGHNDHWHFELLVAPRPGGAGQYVWAIRDNDLLAKLRELAGQRDASDEFWFRFAGLETAPTEPSDFDGLADAADWKQWWNRRNDPCGVSLLPVWAPQEAARTRGVNQCWEPAGDFPDAFKPGEEAAT